MCTLETVFECWASSALVNSFKGSIGLVSADARAVYYEAFNGVAEAFVGLQIVGVVGGELVAGEAGGGVEIGEKEGGLGAGGGTLGGVVGGGRRSGGFGWGGRLASRCW